MAQLTDTPPSPKDSGFQAPKEVPVVNNLIDLDTPPRSRVPKEKIEANDLRSHMMMPPILPGPFGQHHEESDDVPRTPGGWPRQILKVESPPSLNNFVLLNHGKAQKTKNHGADPGSPPSYSSDSSSSTSSCNSDSDNDKWLASLKVSAKKKKRRHRKEEESESDPGLPALPARVPAVKIREADSIKLSPLPATPRFDARKIALRSEVVAASGRPQSAFNWIIQTENPKTTFEEMADCGEFESLGCTLASALGKIAKGSIGRVLTNATKSMAKRSLMTSGRQLLHLTYEQYALEPTCGSLYDLNHLMDIRYHGDTNIEQFLLTWNETVKGLNKPQPHDVLEAILWKQIESSVKMAQPLSRYRMAKQGSSKRSYEYLDGTLARYAKEDRNEKNHSELLSAKNGIKTARAMAGMDAERETPQTTEETTISVAAPAANAPKAACYNFIKGTCTFGDKCAYSHDPKAELSKAERDRLDKAREKREKDMKGKRSKAPCKNHAEGHCKFGDSCQFSHAAPAVPIAATGCCIDLQGDNDIENDSDGEIIYVTLPAVDTVYCMAAQKHMHRIQEWGLDSGSENHLVDGRRFTPRDFEVNGVTMNRPMKLATANGVINADTRMMMDVSILDSVINPIVLENTVDVLSLGRLVIDNGYDLHWTKEHGATLVIDGRKEIRCLIKGYVPMLVDADIKDSFT